MLTMYVNALSKNKQTKKKQDLINMKLEYILTTFIKLFLKLNMFIYMKIHALE